MGKRVKIISILSRKAKFNIMAVIFILFVTVTVFFSVNQITGLIEKREKIVEMEGRLSWLRNENIKLLAEEKSLYSEKGIESEARTQFNMSHQNEYNYFLVTEDIPEGKREQENSYSNSSLWDNIRVFYNLEIKD